MWFQSYWVETLSEHFHVTGVMFGLSQAYFDSESRFESICYISNLKQETSTCLISRLFRGLCLCECVKFRCVKCFAVSHQKRELTLELFVMRACANDDGWTSLKMLLEWQTCETTHVNRRNNPEMLWPAQLLTYPYSNSNTTSCNTVLGNSWLFTVFVR